MDPPICLNDNPGMRNDVTIECSAPQVDELSRSELRVLRYLPTHLSRPAIARELYVSVSTVSTHIRNIYSKLGAGSRTEAVERARQLNLIAR